MAGRKPVAKWHHVTNSAEYLFSCECGEEGLNLYKCIYNPDATYKEEKWVLKCPNCDKVYTIECDEGFFLKATDESEIK